MSAVDPFPASSRKSSPLGSRASRHYLDVDDVYMEDLYNRPVCVVYFWHHSTHLMNVNKAVIDHSPSAISDFLNEFDPTAWSLYAYHRDVTPWEIGDGLGGEQRIAGPWARLNGHSSFL